MRHGYRLVFLTKDDGAHPFTVHRLVNRAFNGEPPTGHVTNHISGDKSDDRAVNLEWVAQRENLAHALRTGLRSTNAPRGAAHHSAKLTEPDVLAIRAAEGKRTAKELAARYGIRYESIHAIWKRRTWKHLD